MKQTIVWAFSVMIAAGAIAYAVLILAHDVRLVSAQLAAISRNTGSAAGDLTSLADDVASIADSLAGEEDEEEDGSRSAEAAGPRWDRGRAPQARVATANARRGRGSRATVRRVKVNMPTAHGATRVARATAPH